MSGSKLTPWQETIKRQLVSLFAREQFRERIDPKKCILDGQAWIKIMTDFDLNLDTLPVLWHYAETYEIDYTLIEDGSIAIIDETTGTLNGLPLDQIFYPGFKRKPTVMIMLDPEANRTATLDYIRRNWDVFIEPGLERLRGGKQEVVRSEQFTNNHVRIYEMGQTMKAGEIAQILGMTSKQVSDVLYRERKKFRHLDK